ncbi:MAG: hypothetical protein ACRENA_00970 [Vulcanimicrobiaceae bacterium]
MSIGLVIISSLIFVCCVFAVVITVIRHLSRKFDADTRAQKEADDRYRAAKKS